MFEQLESLEGKEVYHYSHNDSDGIAPSVISSFSSINTVHFFPCGYNNFEERLSEKVAYFEKYEVLDRQAILITDIAMKSEDLISRLDRLTKAGLTVVLLDHHDTNKWITEKYPHLAFIDNAINGTPTCGTELFYLYLKEKGLLPEHVANSLYMANFVEQIRDYDTWTWAKKVPKNDFAKEMNSLFYLVGAEQFVVTQVEKIAERIDYRGPAQFTFTSEERLRIDDENQREQEYINARATELKERTWHVAGKTYQVGVVYGNQFHSVLGNELHKLNPHLDLVALYDINKGKCSLRTIQENIHVGEIAKAIHPAGGGHAASSGFPFDLEENFNLMEQLLKVNTPVSAEPVVEVEVEEPVAPSPQTKSWASRVFSKK